MRTSPTSTWPHCTHVFPINNFESFRVSGFKAVSAESQSWCLHLRHGSFRAQGDGRLRFGSEPECNFNHWKCRGPEPQGYEAICIAENERIGLEKIIDNRGQDTSMRANIDSDTCTIYCPEKSNALVALAFSIKCGCTSAYTFRLPSSRRHAGRLQRA